MNGPVMTITELMGKTPTNIEGDVGDDRMVFTVDDGTKYIMAHTQDCCEDVRIEDICGDLSDLIGSPIIQAEENTSRDHPKTDDESYTWTFYRLATAIGSVTIRWYGSSNGYYSESVDFEKMEDCQ